MKRLFLLLSCIAISATAYCQITISKTAPKVEEKTVVPYDSTLNYLGKKDVESYVGQLLYVNGKPESLRKFGYDYFYTKKEGSDFGDTYKEAPGSYNSRYEDLAGKYFYVREVVPHSKRTENSYLYGKKWFFHLQNKDDSDDWCWFEYDGEFEHTFPFITISYFNWLKNTKVGIKMITAYHISKENEVQMPINDNDFHTGEKITFNPSDFWEIVDITILDEDFELVYIVSNGKGITSTMKIDNYCGFSWKMTQDEYLSLCKKYGKEMVDVARQQKIKVGMSTELLEKSWGDPEKINRSSYGSDQWVYGNQYVYVERGVITAWN